MKRSLFVCVGAGLASFAGIILAGPLNPPGGPVTGTYKTLAEVSPGIAIGSATTPGDANSLYKITAPGRYYLTGNVAGVTGKHGIEIASGGVSIDLMGFEVQGVAGARTSRTASR